jgi:hypothetical protein
VKCILCITNTKAMVGLGIKNLCLTNGMVNLL